jgi:hypothetical protein
MQHTASARLLSPSSRCHVSHVQCTCFPSPIPSRGVAMLQVASSAPGCAAPLLGRSSRAPRRVRAQQVVGGVSRSSRPAVRPRASQPRLACSPRVGGAVDGSGRQLGRVRRGAVCQARGGDYDDSPTAAERVVAALPYLLPLLDGLRYGAPRPKACLLLRRAQRVAPCHRQDALELAPPGRLHRG